MFLVIAASLHCSGLVR